MVSYATIIGVGLLAIATSLHFGRNIELPPLAAPLVAVAGGAETCLGDRVATLQSGQFVDFYVPGPPGAEAIEDQLGARLGRARIDRQTGLGVFRGMCRGGTALAGQGYQAELVVARSGGVAGTLVADGQPLRLAMASVDPAPGPSGGEPGIEPLTPSEVVARSLLAVAMVLLAARAVGFLLASLHQPRVIGEIAAGIMLGPSLLGAFFPEVTAYLFPSEVIGVLRVMAQFGLIFFMFLIGLDLEIKHVRQAGHLAVLVSHVSIIAPFAMGSLLALALYPVLGSGTYPGFALFMGTAMAITAFPVLARILTDTGLSRTRLGALAITCAAIDDFTAWCLLAVVVSIAQSTGAVDVLVTTALAVGFVALMLLVVRPLLLPLEPMYLHRPERRRPILAALICGLLLAAWATEMIGIHAIFGAFIFGVSVPRAVVMREAITQRLEDLTVLFLLPIFFAVVGLSTRFGMLDQWLHWLIAAAVVAVAVAGKWGGSAVAARVMGVDWCNASALGVLMNTRGLTELVILTIGRSLGVISPALFAVMVIMALVTTLMATPILSRTYLPHLAAQPELASPRGEPVGTA